MLGWRRRSVAAIGFTLIALFEGFVIITTPGFGRPHLGRCCDRSCGRWPMGGPMDRGRDLRLPPEGCSRGISSTFSLAKCPGSHHGHTEHQGRPRFRLSRLCQARGSQPREGTQPWGVSRQPSSRVNRPVSKITGLGPFTVRLAIPRQRGAHHADGHPCGCRVRVPDQSRSRHPGLAVIHACLIAVIALTTVFSRPARHKRRWKCSGSCYPALACCAAVLARASA
jgi:hypothetical protein